MKLRDKEVCHHPSQTLCQVNAEIWVIGQVWFACYQCNSCGSITQKEVTPSDLEGANDLPWLDVDSYEARVYEADEEETEWLALSFMNVAAHDTGRNGNGRR